MSSEIEVNYCYFIWLFNYEWKFPTFTYVVEVMFNLRTLSHVLATVIKLF